MELHSCQPPGLAAGPLDEAAGCEPAGEILSQCAGRLEALVRRCQAFLVRQFGRIDEVTHRLERTAERQAAISQELQRQQVLWEQTRQKQAEQIAEEVEMLSSAWDRIEEDRRSLLASEASLPPREGAGTPDVVPAQLFPLSSGPGPEPFLSFESSGTGRSAVLQFQQIRREIRQHARRNPS